MEGTSYSNIKGLWCFMKITYNVPMVSEGGDFFINSSSIKLPFMEFKYLLVMHKLSISPIISGSMLLLNP